MSEPTCGNRYRLFTEITALGFHLNRLEVHETDTSVVVYTREDWVADRLFRSESAQHEVVG